MDGQLSLLLLPEKKKKTWS